MFSEDYPRFIEVSELTASSDSQPDAPGQRRSGRSALEQANRMNERYEAIFASNRDIFEGARVLDLASHDGRYSFAAMQTGAAHVTGIEARQSLIDRARDTFDFYGQNPETYRFICGDVFEALAEEKFEVDVVLCLGYLYHTYRHTELMYRLHALSPTHMIVDTMVTPGKKPILRMQREKYVQDIRNAAQDAWAVNRVLVLWPSVRALQLLMRGYGFEVESMYDWKSRLADRSPIRGLEGYAKGRRVTMRCRSRAAAKAAGWPPVAPLPAAAGPAPRARDTEQPSAVQLAERDGGWRERVNKTLAKATGYELRRVHTKR